MTITAATVEQDVTEQEAAREYADELARAAGAAFLAAHPDGKFWTPCQCGTPNCWAEVAQPSTADLRPAF